ncbi:hypothetical protein J3B02_005624 [Coemansia erecta]|nr:hypothetical protein J3B02_005624 [Coemansia erecta]
MPQKQKQQIQMMQPNQPTPNPASTISASDSLTSESAKSEKTAKAQAAASMLTDVLRRLAKKDPALATLTGVLDKKSAGSTARDALAVADDDDSPLDAKLAEAEKLIIDMHKN